jgi:glycosyltransferase involved in cell wall biosynthesis
VAGKTSLLAITQGGIVTDVRRKTCLLVSLQTPRMPGGGGEIRGYFLTLMAAKMFDLTLISLGGSDGRGGVSSEVRERCVRVIEPGEASVKDTRAGGKRGRLMRWWAFLRTLIWPAGNEWNDYLSLLLQYGQSTASGRKRWICFLVQWHFRCISPFVSMPPVTSLLFRESWLKVRAAAIAAAASQRFDVIWVEHSLVWPFASQLVPEAAHADATVICSGQNIEWHLLTRQASNTAERAARWFYQGQARLMRRMEVSAWRRADVNLQCSPADATCVGQSVTSPVVMISNGVNVDYFQRRAESAAVDSSLVVFTAGFGYAPNQEALFWFLHRVLPLVHARRPETRFLFAGSQANQAASMAGLSATDANGGIEWISDPVDIRPCFERACVYVVPILSGGGTRLKILEAMAMQVPVVSTSVGAEGVPYRSGEHLLLADTEASFAEAVLRLLEDAELRHRLSTAGRRFVESNYRWETLCERAESQILQLMGNGVAAGNTRKADRGAMVE